MPQPLIRIAAPSYSRGRTLDDGTHLGTMDRTVCAGARHTWMMEDSVDDAISRLIGVYRADGGPVGEIRYLIGHYLRGLSCSLCDITHATFRRKVAWDERVLTLGIPFELVHLNEMEPSLAAFVGDRAACVVADTASGWELVLGNDELAATGGDVDAFMEALRSALGPRIQNP